MLIVSADMLVGLPIEMINCAVCSKALNAQVIHTGRPCEEGKPAFPAFATSGDEYEKAMKFFDADPI